MKPLTYLHQAIFSHTQIVYAQNKEFYEDFFDLMSRILAKVHFDNILGSSSKEEVRLIMKLVMESVDEYCRVLLLKMNPDTFKLY